MQVRSNSYGNKSPILLRNTLPYSNQKRVEKKLSFTQEKIISVPEAAEEKKKGLSVKRITNILGVVLGVGAVGAYVISQWKRPAGKKIVDGYDKQLKKLGVVISDTKEKLAENELKKSGVDIKKSFGYKAGSTFNKWAEGSKELFNNLVYGFGTVIIMPLVILFSPIGKRKASKEDKWFTVARQPLSFATMFSMQLTVDKFFKDFVPKLVKKNSFEKDFTDSNGKVKIDNIKYNHDLHKEDFVKIMTEELKVSKDKTNEILKFSTFAEAQNHLNNNSAGLDAKTISAATNRLETFFKTKGRAELLTQTLVILTNVFFSAPVGCTLLNVLYGKCMKTFRSKPQEKLKTLSSDKGGK